MNFKMIAAIGIVALLGACSDDPETLETGSTDGASGAGVPGQPPRDSAEYFNLIVGDRVFFNTDQSSIRPDAQGTLIKQAQWLAEFPATTVTIEGHADERGTREYNLALGARRADAVRNFLVTQGVEAARLRTVTFGKERPVALCSDESCWSQNRRGVSIVAGAPTG